MSEYQRLSELTGIAKHGDLPEEQPTSMWQLNFVLISLGATILGVAFYFLDPNDQRIMHNPWTYAVASPVLLLLFSIAISNLVSRVVEKSMQMAFLLSVLIHLLLLVYAVNIVIFSRMWPDMLDSLQAQREQLKRETLQANQYLQVTSNSMSGKRPDYMRYVPTEATPTELKQADSPAIQMARSEKIDLVSPSPAMERTVTPHLIEREKPSTTTPSVSQQAASLSRSALAETKRIASVLEVATLPSRSETMPTLEANEATAAKRRGGKTELPQKSLSVPQPERQAAFMEMKRAAAEPLSMPATSAESSLTPQNLPRQRVAAAASPRGSTPSVTKPSVTKPVEMSLTPSSSSSAAPTASAAAAPSRRQSSATRPALTPTPPSQPQPTTLTSPIASSSRSPRRESEYALPSPASGDSRIAIARDIAGGTVGPTAASSNRVQGPDALAAPEASTVDLRAASVEVARQYSGARRSSAALPNVGSPQSATWNGAPSMAGGVSGRSPSQLAASADSGNALDADVAGLSGSTGAIERSALGLAGPRGTLSVPSGVNAPEVGEAGSAELAGGASEPSTLEPGSAALSRSRRGGQSLTSPGVLSNETPAATAGASSIAGLPSGIQRAQGSQGTELQSTAEAESGMALPRSEAGATAGLAPSTTPVQVPDSGLAGNAPLQGEPEGLQASGSLSRSTRDSVANSLSAPMLLELDAVEGPGGLADLPDLVGPILPRRRDLEPVMTVPQIEAQRFARSEVGGPLAAGRDVAIPKPAFQQRLERLQNPDSGNEAAFEPQTELAIERGLAFLAKYQRPDGSWRLQDFDTPELKVLMRSDTAATGLALLAFQGAGYTHKQFKYADTVNRAIQFLAEHQTEDGDLFIPQDPASNQNAWLYSHSIASLALCEAYGMTQDEELRPVAQQAINFMVASQDPKLGGWRYRPGSGTDTSVTGWFMMAFKSGQLAGLEVPKSTFDKIETFLEKSQDKNGTPHLFRYNPYAPDTPQQRHGLQPTAVMTSVGLLMRLYFGWKRDKAEMIDGADYLLGHLPEHGTQSASMRDTYYWYYATQVIFHMSGERWEKWHDQLYPMLINNQVTEGDDEGSWDPMRPTPDLWARYGGRLYVTTMNLLSLEVSYRHLPLYDATAQ